MNFEELKSEFDSILNELTVEELVSGFEELGYEFEPIENVSIDSFSLDDAESYVHETSMRVFVSSEKLTITKNLSNEGGLKIQDLDAGYAFFSQNKDKDSVVSLAA